jgi:hypothetical protein
MRIREIPGEVEVGILTSNEIANRLSIFDGSPDIAKTPVKESHRVLSSHAKASATLSKRLLVSFMGSSMDLLLGLHLGAHGEFKPKTL